MKGESQGIKALQARAVRFRYKGKTSYILDNIDLALEEGQITGITGSSGCGKSTLGYCLCGVIPRFITGDFSGEVSYNGRIGIVFQDPDTQIFLPTVEDELAFGPENLNLPREEIGQRISLTLELLGLTNLRYANPSELSGGQKQLVALGGVLTLSPDIIVFDESLSQLDIAAKEKVKKILLSLKQAGKTLIMIEHDKRNLDIADQIWQLNNGMLVQLVSSEGGESGA